MNFIDLVAYEPYLFLPIRLISKNILRNLIWINRRLQISFIISYLTLRSSLKSDLVL